MPSTDHPQGDTALDEGRRHRRLIDVFCPGTGDMMFKISVRDAIRDRWSEARDVI